jgi:predicted TIM-barrel fold metal-dependent hydrolase
MGLYGKDQDGMLIDCHTHLTLTQTVTKRTTGKTYPTPEQLVGLLDKFGIDKAVVLAGVSPECRHRYVPPEDVLTACERHPDRLIPFCSFDPRMDTNSAEADFSRFLTYYKEAGCKGVGETTANLPFDDPMVHNLFCQVEEAELPLTFHIAPKIGGVYGLYDELGLPRLEKTLQAFPKLIFLGHSQPFWAEMSGDLTEETRNTYPKGPVKPGGRTPELFAKYPNLYGDLSAGSGYNAISRDPEFGYGFLEEYQDRLLFGTDFAFPDQEPEQPGYYCELVEEGHISQEVFEKIAWKNANRILKLGIED